MNFPYLDSESEPPMEERGEVEVEAPDFKVPETSIKKKIIKALKI
jgi:hypothetical protein